MRADAIDLLRCPSCGDPLADAGGALRCPAGHSYDVARQGYVNLLAGGAETGTADPAAMVEARDAFLATGAYRPLADRVAGTVERLAPDRGCLLDLGAGTGYYLAAALERMPGRTGLALDLSKHAARRAARAHPDVGAAVCDAWRPLPVREGVAAAVLSVFSPRNPAEIARVLDPSGVLVLAVPTERHLAEAIPALGLLEVDERKRERLGEKLGSRFRAVGEELVEHPLSLDRATLRDLVAMGPSAYHLDDDELSRRIGALAEPTEVTVSVSVAAFRAARP